MATKAKKSASYLRALAKWFPTSKKRLEHEAKMIEKKHQRRVRKQQRQLKGNEG